jgi:predicted SAM-dependent methyltransferase
MDQTNGELLDLHIGGMQPKDGWVILNAQPGPGVDLVGDITDLRRFADNSFARIYCSHVLEHVSQADILPTLKGLHRILKPGGKLYISVPDLDVLCHLMLSPRLAPPQKFHVMRMMFGGQVDAFDFHKIGLNITFLADYLEQAKFSSMEQVDGFGLFDDTSDFAPYGGPISLNVIAEK